MASATDDYDWADDHGKNIEFAYAFIRERVAKGGKGWKGYPMNEPKKRFSAWHEGEFLADFDTKEEAHIWINDWTEKNKGEKVALIWRKEDS